MASPKRYKAKLARVRARILYFLVQNTKSGSRTQERFLQAASMELEPHALVEVRPGGIVDRHKLDEPYEELNFLISYEALCGVKVAAVAAISDPEIPFRERQDLIEAMAGFGDEFLKMVKKESKLPETEDLGGEDELDGVPPVTGEEPKEEKK